MKLEDIEPLPCTSCGITGIHSCSGKPIEPMTEERKQELNQVLSEVFDKKDK